LEIENISPNLVKEFGKLFFNKGLLQKTLDNYPLSRITSFGSSFIFSVYRIKKSELKDYIPEVVDESFGKVLLRDMMAHRAGFTAWIPFYKKTLVKGDLSTTYYREKQEKGFAFYSGPTGVVVEVGGFGLTGGMAVQFVPAGLKKLVLVLTSIRHSPPQPKPKFEQSLPSDRKSMILSTRISVHGIAFAFAQALCSGRMAAIPPQ
jgi:hypothetical protein